ncbi:MAG: hypothetical protein GY782_09845 [Gammaproteobacteria bacterium]|nr:hypothetical protein [Gammaproteobacteria bacterium]
MAKTITADIIQDYLNSVHNVSEITTNANQLKPSQDKLCPTTAAFKYLKKVVATLYKQYPSNTTIKNLEKLLRNMPSGLGLSDMRAAYTLYSRGLAVVQLEIMNEINNIIDNNDINAPDYFTLLKAFQLVLLVLEDDLTEDDDRQVLKKNMSLFKVINLNENEIRANHHEIKNLQNKIETKWLNQHKKTEILNNAIYLSNSNNEKHSERNINSIASPVLDDNAITPYKQKKSNGHIHINKECTENHNPYKNIKNIKDMVTKNHDNNKIDDDISSVIAEPGNIKKTRKFPKLTFNLRQWEIWKKISGASIWNLSIFHFKQWRLLSIFRKNKSKVLQNTINDQSIMNNSIEADTSTQYIGISIQKENSEIDINKQFPLGNYDNQSDSAHESNILDVTSNDTTNGNIFDDQGTPVYKEALSSNNYCCSKSISGWASWFSDYATYLIGSQDTTQDDVVYESTQKECLI